MTFFHSISSGLMEGLELDISPTNLIFSLTITSFSISPIPTSSLNRSATHHQWLCFQFFFAQFYSSLSNSWYPSVKSIPNFFSPFCHVVEILQYLFTLLSLRYYHFYSSLFVCPIFGRKYFEEATTPVHFPGTFQFKSRSQLSQ